MISDKLEYFLERLREEDIKGTKTDGHLQISARFFLNNRRDYEEYETFIFGWCGEVEVHHMLLSLLCDNI
jgi:hypothetical protein